TDVLGDDNVIESLPASAGRLKTVPPRALRAILRASRNLGTTLLRHRMEHVTGYAFAELPCPPPPSLRPASTLLAADPPFPIPCRSAGRPTVLAANGHSIALPHSKTLEEMIRSLNCGAAVSLSRRRGRVSPAVREALRFLLLRGAVEIHDARGSRE